MVHGSSLLHFPGDILLMYREPELKGGHTIRKDDSKEDSYTSGQWDAL